MNVDYSKDFKKSVKKLSGKMLDSVRRVVAEVKSAESLKVIRLLFGHRFRCHKCIFLIARRLTAGTWPARA